MNQNLKSTLSSLGLLKHARRFRRYTTARSYYEPKYKMIRKWVFNSQEDANFTYKLTDRNLLYLAHTCSFITNLPVEKCQSYMAEIFDNQEIKKHVDELTLASGQRDLSDSSNEFGRRLGWYTLVRAMKPKVVVETGVDKGLGAVALTHALMKNKEEGFEGQYYGTDINPKAGYLLSGKYKEFGKILYGDSLESLAKLNEKIDFFINDSDHSADYESKEYDLIESKLSEQAIILADNAHVTDRLAKFALRTGRKFLFFKEEPKDHWYPGAGIGICFGKPR